MPKSNTVNRMPGEREAAETGGEKSERLQTVRREREGDGETQEAETQRVADRRSWQRRGGGDSGGEK